MLLFMRWTRFVTSYQSARHQNSKNTSTYFFFTLGTYMLFHLTAAMQFTEIGSISRLNTLVIISQGFVCVSLRHS